MNYLSLLLAAVAIAAIYLFVRPRKRPAAAPPPDISRTHTAAPGSTPLATSTGPRPILRPMNLQVQAMLGDCVLTQASDLPAPDAHTIGQLLGRIPRPPSALHKLVAPAFLAEATTGELSDMVMAEPQVAAKVLVVVNSALYGLRTPLGSIGQAVTFLGMNSVRGICLQYLLDASFRPDDPEIKRIFAGLWNASAFASELCLKLAQRLHLPEPGTLVTRVVLSFLGHVASHSLLPKPVVIAMMSKGLLERSRIEQETMGLCAAELGGLLMLQWELPASIVAQVRAIDRVLLTPCPLAPALQDSATAFCYVCARLGEKLARGEVTDLAAFRLDLESGPEFFHLQGYLQQPALVRLSEFLHQPEMVSGINSMVQAMQLRS